MAMTPPTITGSPSCAVSARMAGRPSASAISSWRWPIPGASQLPRGPSKCRSCPVIACAARPTRAISPRRGMPRRPRGQGKTPAKGEQAKCSTSANMCEHSRARRASGSERRANKGERAAATGERTKTRFCLTLPKLSESLGWLAYRCRSLAIASPAATPLAHAHWKL